MESSTITKSCSRCKQIKPLSDFNKSKDTELGYRSSCKECEREDSKRYKKYIDCKCERCGIGFKRRADNKNANFKHCKECTRKITNEKRKGKILEASRKGQYVTCDNCGSVHYKKKSQLTKGYTHQFCSTKCQGEWSAKHYVPNEFIKSADNSGEKNGRYKHGKRIGSHDRHKKLKEQIKHRDGEGCLICKSNNKLHVHRIFPGGLGGKYILENTVILCNVHHAAVHKDYEIWKEKLLRLINGKIA